MPAQHSAPADLSPDVHRRLIGAMRLLASPVDGERNAAAAAIGRIVTTHNLDLGSLLARPATPKLARREPPLADTLATDLIFVGRRAAQLSEWERAFVTRLASWRGTISPAQRRKLGEIAKRLRTEGAR